MYYDNKFGFYIKQYGTHIIVSIICCIIVLAGLLLYFKINDNKNYNSALNNATANDVENNSQVDYDDSMLPQELRDLETGKKESVKVATIEDEGVLVILTNNSRVKAKLIGVDYTEIMPDTFYLINQDLEGQYVDIAFDEHKAENGYAMVYVYLEKDKLYNSKVLEQGNAILSSNLSKASLEYNDLAESQAYAKQNLAGVWGD